VKGSDQIIESNKSRPFKFGRLARDEDCEAGKIEVSSSSSGVDNMLDSSLWRMRVRVSGGPSLVKLRRPDVDSIGVLEARESIGWRLSEFERDCRLLLEAEEDVVVEVVEEDVDSAD